MRGRRTREAKAAAIKQVVTAAKLYEDHSINVLKASSYRITMPRVQVIRALADTEVALSAYAIHEKILAGGGKIDVVSVYRILATLQDVGLIHHIGVVDGYFPSRMDNENTKMTQVIVDEETGIVVELIMPDAIKEIIAAQAAENRFETDVVKIEIKALLTPKRR